MDFNLTQEQKIFRETVYRYGREEIAPLCEEADLKGDQLWDMAQDGGIWDTGVAYSRGLGWVRG